VLPTFLRESRTTTRRLTKFAQDTDPLITQLRPAARELSPTLQDLDALAPDLRGLFRNIDPLVRVSRRGLPATEEALNNTRPLLGRVDTFLKQFTPIVDYLGLYRREIAAFFGNVTAASNPSENGLRYLRTQNPMTPEMMAAYPNRLATNRSNPYIEPGGYSKLSTGLESFAACGNRIPVPEPPAAGGGLTQELATNFAYYAFGGTANRNAAPPCTVQAPLGPRTNGGSGAFPRLQPLP